MHKPIYFVTICCMASFVYSTSFAEEPENISLLKDKVAKYYESGEYEKDTAKLVNNAQSYLQEKIIENEHQSRQQKLAIVFDIDDTLLSTQKCSKNLNYTGNSSQLGECIMNSKLQAIPQTLNLYKFAKTHNVAIFIVTGRSQQALKSTEEVLKHVGYDGWNALYLKPDTYKEKSIAPYKIASRKNIADQGYDIVLNIGDQNSDLAGGYADKTFKMPNPTYFLP